ncbi:MAG: UDP-N-acetylglucosamine--N-acetylmuramyl-(pentapeptide) pyrophosphoryl-undecaprenol N-acetylglucosamine transferase [Gemmatimonadaceae bacterium]|nr:UDP-N-acetylglucosamine--N-acetylmuramyl-(pentapeptide) pyrophosphoryl-undecaprenol N-acetylglucosamine transferase [Gemmatimonadaceae bacterium]
MTAARTVVFTGGGTGGHLYPGIAIARALRALRPEVQPFFVGAQRGIERDVLPTTEFPHLLLDLHPLYRPRVWQNWRTLRGALASWGRLDAMARERRPVAVVGTGGYAAGLTSLWAWRRGLPLVQHIGDAIPGITARWSARLSTEAYLGYPEAERYLPHGRCTYRDTGNPIEPPPDIRPARAEARAQWGFPASATVLLVFGGSQGARALNRVVAAWAERGLPEGLCVLWATGKAQFDAYKHLDRPDLRVFGYLAPIARAYATADLALVRGGMMGSSELCAWGVPMLVVPLPSAANDHQTANAKVLEAAGAARHLPERELTADRLSAELGALLGDPARLQAMRAAALTRGRPRAAAEIAAHIARLLPAG